MSDQISDTLISELSRFVDSKTGLSFPKEKWRDLTRNIQAAAPDLGFTDTEACIRWILSTPLTKEQINILVGHLTIGETFFFRDRAVFDALKDHILTPWATSRSGHKKHLRFWSAACCTGEEAYSIAMLLDEMAGMFQGWKITIVGTDINSSFLEKAQKGIYTRWSFRDMPDWLTARYFTKIGRNQYEIAPHIQKMVSFFQLNLIEDGPVSLPGGFDAVDVIFCRNALMYLSPEMRSRAIDRLARTLTVDGWLIVSPSETALIKVPELHSVRLSGATILRKKSPGNVANGESERPLLPVTASSKGGTRRSFYPPPIQPIPSFKSTAAPPFSVLPLGREKASDQKHAIYQESLTLYERGHYQDVIDKLDGFLSDDAVSKNTPRLPETMALLAKAHADLGRLEEARKWGERAVSIDKLNPDHYSLLAAIYQEMGLREEPIICLKRVIYLDPERIMAHFMLGHLLQRQGKANEANRSFAAALDLLLSMEPDETVPHSEGLKAGGLRETVRGMLKGERGIGGLRQPVKAG